MLPFDNLIVTVPNVTPQKFKDLMEWGVAAARRTVRRQRQVPADQRLQDRRERHRPRTAQMQSGTTITTPGTRIQSITLDNGTKIVENGAVVAGAPNGQPGHDELHRQQR